LAQVSPAGGFEVIVIDGDSDDGTSEMLQGIVRSDPRVRIVHNVGRIVSAGLNLGIRQARGSVIVRMDVHTAYAPDYLCACVKALQDSGADNVGGPWIAIGDGWLSGAIAAAFNNSLVMGGPRSRDKNYQGDVDTVYLGCWKREAFDSFGYFDEELVRNQDDEHNLRINSNGGRVFQSPRISSSYHCRPSISQLFRQYNQYGFWKVKVIQKFGFAGATRHYIPSLGLAIAFLLAGLSPFLLTARYSFVAALLGYVFLNLTLTSIVARSTSYKFLPLLPFIIAAIHLGYGAGFIQGILTLVVLKQSPGERFQSLTRR
jgi:glycosyltransferase involved in cell wall biosynthesis